MSIPVEMASIVTEAPSVDVIIPHYGEQEHLDECLESLKGDPAIRHIEVIDNNEKNRGFTLAVNEGIRKLFDSPAKFIAIVNNDTKMVEGGFGNLVARMVLSPKAGMVAPMSVIYDNPDQIQHAGGEQAFPNGVHRGGLRSLGHCNEPARCKWLSFVVVLIRKEAILDVGLLDEKMFLIGSDSDYGYRMRYAGWECWYEPTCVFKHKCGESSGATSETSANIQRTDMFHWYRKWIKPGGAFVELSNEVT